MGEPRNNQELFLGYKICTSEIGEKEKRNDAIDINSFVMNYVHNRQSQLALVKSVSKHNGRSPECLFMKKEPKKIFLPSLKFTEEVISCRGDPSLSSYFSTDMKKIYALGDLSITITPRTQETPHVELARQSEAKRKRLKARQMCVDDENAIAKNLPY